MTKETPVFYLVSDSIEDDIQGIKECTLVAARKSKKEWDEENGVLFGDDCPPPDTRIYKVILVK
ncbi:MAG: hypothetical protein WA766_14030 [Candidatus Acidiferrales bacterium]